MHDDFQLKRRQAARDASQRARARVDEDGQMGAFGLVIKRRQRSRDVESVDWLDSVIV